MPDGIDYSQPATGAQYSGQDIAYGHYANGYIQSIWDKATGTYTRYEYDALNRVTRIEDTQALISYEYDANSNRRMVKSVYHDGLNGAERIQEYWYSYDKMDRFLVTMGALSTGTRATSATQTGSIVTGTTGTAIAYNLAGDRMTATNGIDGTVETYSYTADGYLTDVKINGVCSLVRRNKNGSLGCRSCFPEITW